jgi:2-amino-4-hydroxy-6-hydroxymethyldihydropteridine diphosphokinase
MISNQTISPAGLCFVALGSNLGDSRLSIRQAMERLQTFSDRPLLRSSLWQTTPVDCPPGSPIFINAAVGLVTLADETPETMLAKLKAVEREFGRPPKTIFNQPRPLDLDLIAFGKQRRNTPDLILPHPRAHQRRFVLQPMAEITPDFVIPGQSETIAVLLIRLTSPETVVRLSEF